MGTNQTVEEINGIWDANLPKVVTSSRYGDITNLNGEMTMRKNTQRLLALAGMTLGAGVAFGMTSTAAFAADATDNGTAQVAPGPHDHDDGNQNGGHDGDHHDGDHHDG